MGQTVQITAACVFTALAALLLKRAAPELALLAALAASVAAAAFLAGNLRLLLAFLAQLEDRTGVDGALFQPLYKIIAIALVVRVGGSLCRDAGESGLASVVETAGAVCALAVSLPLLQTALSLLMELMNG